MATAKKAAPAAKKVAPKSAPAPKAVPAKKATPAKAAPAPKTSAADEKAAKAAKAEASKAAQAKRDERAAARAEQINETMKLRAEGSKWPEVAEALGISIGKAQLLGKIGEAQASGSIKKATPALVRKDRDERQLGWDDIGVQYGLNKGQVQKLYREAGGDPHTSYVGKGGRYFSHEAAIAPLRAAKAAAATPKEKAPAKAKVAAATAKPLFDSEADAEVVKTKINARTITVVSSLKGLESTSEVQVKDGSVKVGKQKDGTRVVQLTDRKTGATRTFKLEAIVKVSKG